MVQKVKEGKNYFFVDESGDSTFFNRYGKVIVGKEGCSKILLIGFIETTNPEALRASIIKLSNELKNDDFISGIPSFKQKTITDGFHAKNDSLEVKEKVFKLIKSLDFKCHVFIARKDVERFCNNRFEGKPNKFYDYIVTKLFENRLHLYEENHIYFSERGSSNRLNPLRHAVNLAIEGFNSKWNIEKRSETHVIIQRPYQEPCLQIIDYLNWAIYRAIIKGESHYFDFIQDKYSLVVDIFDTKKAGKENNWKNYYDRKNNPFHPKKMSPL